MFPGSSGRRKINLGGRSRKKEGKDDLVLRLERERKKRKQEKERNIAANCIQTFWRSKSLLHIERIKEREEWDNTMEKFNKLPSTIRSAIPFLFPFIRQFTFFHRLHTDKERLLSICELIFLSSKNHGAANLFNPVFGPSPTPNVSATGFLVQMKNLLSICLLHICNIQKTQNVDLQPIFKVVFLFCDPLCLPVDNSDKENFCVQFIHHTVQHELYKAVCRRLDFILNVEKEKKEKEEEGEKNQVVKSLMDMALLPLKYREVLDDKTGTDFVINFLSLRGLSSILSEENKSTITTALPFVLSTENTYIVTRFKRRILLSNMLSLGPTVMKNDYITVLSCYLLVISHLLDITPYVLSSSTGKSSQDDEDGLLGRSNSHAKDELFARFEDMLTPKVLESLFSRFILEEQREIDVKNALDKGKQKKEEKGKYINIDDIGYLSSMKSCVHISDVGEGIPQALVSLCKVCDVLQSKGSNSVLLNTLGWNRTIIIGLWMFLSNTDRLQLFAKKGYQDGMEEWIPVLSLFCQCYVHQLRVLDDIEFFSNAVFSVEENVKISGLLNKIVFHLLMGSGDKWSEETYGSIHHRLTKQLIRLLDELHERNSRRRYCPTDHWIIPSLTSYVPSSDTFQTIIMHTPYMIPLRNRVQQLHNLIENDKNSIGVDMMRMWRPDSTITVRRDFIFEDGFEALQHMEGGDLKGVLRVKFISADGIEEAGVDGGGVFKEFLTELCASAFNPEYGLWKATDDNVLTPNPAAVKLDARFEARFEFLGMVIGKAMYESILVEVEFANCFLSKLLGKYSFHNDLASLDPILHKNLMFVKNYEEDVEELGLNFAYVVEGIGEVEEVPLKPGGTHIPVTNDNKIEYVFLLSHFLLNTQIKRHCNAFLKGFSKIINPSWIKMFDQHELHLLIAGTEGKIDVSDLRRNTRYGGEYNDKHPTIVMLWDVIASFSAIEQRNLLKFVTSCSRPPLLGFGYLRPSFTIHQSSGDESRLPTSSTCMNLLKLPQYSNPYNLKDKLLYAINSGAGFDLS